MTDHIDNLIEALVRAREVGVSRIECIALVRDVFAAPWSSSSSFAEPVDRTTRTAIPPQRAAS
jgi:hypothetical protein